MDPAPISANTAPSVPVKVAYGIGSIAVGVKDAGFRSLLLIYYSQVVGVPAQRVAFALMISLIIEAVLDPLIGYVSDHWHSRLGRRHPFMYVSALPASVAFALLWFPPADWPRDALLAYLTIASITVRACIALYEIPSVSLVAELTSDYDARTSLMSYRYYCFFTGGIVLSLLTFRVFLQPDATYPVGQLNPHGYHRYAVVAAVVMLVSILIAAVGTHRCIPHLRRPTQVRPTARQALAELLTTFSHRSFLMVTVAGLCKSCTIGLAGALNIFLFTYLYELTSSEIAVLQLDSLISAVVAASLTTALARRFGKKAVCLVLYIGAPLIMGTPLVLRHCDLLWANGSPYLVPTLFTQGVLFAFAGIASTILAQSMIADVAEDLERKTGQRSEGVLFSAGSLIAKAISGVGVLGAGLILAYVGFPENAQPGQVPLETLDQLTMTYLPVAIGLHVIGLLCLSRYSLTRESHAANVAALRVSR